MFLPDRRGTSVPAYFARLSSVARSSRKRMSRGVKSCMFSRLRLWRLNAMTVSRFVMGGYAKRPSKAKVARREQHGRARGKCKQCSENHQFERTEHARMLFALRPSIQEHARCIEK